MTDPAASLPPLKSLGNTAPSPELVAGLRLLEAFSTDALERLWTVLGPALTDPVPRRLPAALDAFARDHGLPSDDTMARAVRACRAIVRGASLRELDAATFASELELLGVGAAVIDVLRRGFDAARAQVRGEAIGAAMMHHGRALLGVSWRLDQVLASSDDVRFAVAVLTLHTRSREREEHFTVQVTSDRLRELQALCERLLGPLR